MSNQPISSRARWTFFFSDCPHWNRCTLGRSASALKQVSGDILQVSDGSLYPALHKLEQEGGSKPNGWLRKTADCQVLFAHTTGPSGVGSAKPQTGNAAAPFLSRSTQRGLNHA